MIEIFCKLTRLVVLIKISNVLILRILKLIRNSMRRESNVAIIRRKFVLLFLSRILLTNLTIISIIVEVYIVKIDTFSSYLLLNIDFLV